LCVVKTKGKVLVLAGDALQVATLSRNSTVRQRTFQVSQNGVSGVTKWRFRCPQMACLEHESGLIDSEAARSAITDGICYVSSTTEGQRWGRMWHNPWIPTPFWHVSRGREN